MFCLARATRGLSNAAAFRRSTPSHTLTKAASWTIRRSIRTTSGSAIKTFLFGTSKSTPESNEERTATPTNSFIRRVYVLSKIPSLPEKTHTTSTTADPTNTLVKDTRRGPASRTQFVSVRRQYIRPFPTVVVFSGLPGDTTIADVLLHIREARVTGKMSDDDGRIIDARMDKVRAKYVSASAIVEFTIASDAKRIHSLSRAGLFTIRGIVPQTALKQSGSARKSRPPASKGKASPLGSIRTVNPAEKRQYLDQLKLKDKLVRRSHLNYNREHSSAVEDEEQLKRNTVLKTILSHARSVPADDSERGKD